jgi:uncharacterized membrane protein YebE (DUF533 family)
LTDSGQLLALFLKGVLGRSGRKRARKAAKFIAGHKGFITASGVLAAAGVAWGIYDSLHQPSAGGMPGTSPSTTGPAPPVPVPAAAANATAVSGRTIPAEVLRIIRLAVSAARADGELSAQERALILEHACRAGVGAEAACELDQPHTLGDIVSGVTDDRARRDLYVLAFTIVRADESITGGERIYLAQLAHRLGLDATTTASLETETSRTIDAMPAS